MNTTGSKYIWAFFLSTVIWGGYFIAPAGLASEKPVVTVYKVAKIDMSSKLEVFGTLNYLTKADVGSEISGIIRCVDVEVGDRVTKGQVVAVLDTAILESELKEAHAILEIEEINLEKRNNEIRKVEYRVESSQTAMEKAKEYLANQKSLFQIGVTTQEQQNEAEIRYHNALTEYRSNLADLESMRVKSSQGRSEVEAKTRRVRAQIENIQAKLNKCRILAPISGVVAEKRKWSGETINAMTPVIVTIINTETLCADIELSENKLAAAAVGQDVRVTADALPNEVFWGTVHLISPTIDPTSGTVRVRVNIENKQNLLKPGMFVRADIILNNLGNVLAVPKEAIVSQAPHRPALFVVIDGVAFLRSIRIRERRGDLVIVEAGVKEGELVIVEGQDNLKDLSSVEVLERP